MTDLTLTKELAYASGLDAGNRSMRAAGRKAWNDDDWNAAAAVTNRLLLHVYADMFRHHGVPDELKEYAHRFDAA